MGIFCFFLLQFFFFFFFFFYFNFFFFFFYFNFFLSIENLNLFFHHHFPVFLSPSFKLDQTLCSFLVIEKYVHRFGQEDGTNRQAGGHILPLCT